MFHEPYGANAPLQNWQTPLTTRRKIIHKNQGRAHSLDKFQEEAEVPITTINHKN
jgi:hypothetical protein